jgi:acylphosphatase
MMPPEKTVLLRITGRVQAVGYRLWATRTAASLGLRGWVRNRANGSVEVLAIGPSETVADFIAACRQGPRAAQVTAVSVAEVEDDGSLGFSALPTD